MTEANLEEGLGVTYRQHHAIANSDLKYLGSPRMFQLKKTQQLIEDKESHQETGTIIDEYLLNPDEFNSKFILIPEDLKTPGSPQQSKYVDLIKEAYPIEDETDLLDMYASCYKVSEKAMEDGTALKKAIELYKELKRYIDLEVESEGKQRYSAKDKEMLDTIVENCSNNKWANRFLFKPAKGDKIFKHLKIIGMEKWGVEWKGELDLLVVNFIDKEIHNIDLKSTSKPLSGFGWQYKKYRYHRQQALYLKLALHFLVENNIIAKDDLPEWSVYTKCIAIETTGLNEVAVFPIPYEVLMEGEEMLIEAAEKIKFYTKNGWDFTESYMKNNGLELIDWDELK